MILTLEQIKAQLRLEPDYTEEDELLKLIGSAVEARTTTYLNRKLYETEVPETDEDGLLISDDIRQAMLMLCSHLYEHRSTVTDAEMVALPMAYEWMVGPYRYIPL
nr:head-tail connector protein [Pantoea agglomerans]